MSRTSEVAAPLASMEDISQLNTPLPTPGPSPRTKHRWSQRSSLGIIIDEEESDFDKFDTVPEYEAEKIETMENGDSDDIMDDANNKLLAQAQQLLPARDTFIVKEPKSPNQTERRCQKAGNGFRSSQGVMSRTNIPMTWSCPRSQNMSTETQFLTPRRSKKNETSICQQQQYQQLELENGRKHSLVTDRYRLVFINILLQGFSISLPFNLVILSNKFYKYLFACEYESNNCSPSWISSLTILLITASSLQLLIAIPTSFFPVRWFSIRVSISLVSLVITTLSLIVSLLTKMTTYFILPCSIMISMFTGLYFVCLCGMLARLPSAYNAAIFLGMNFSGVFVSILESCLEMFKVNDKLLTIYYLIFVLAAYLASFDLNFALPCNEYYQQYTHRCRSSRKSRLKKKHGNNQLAKYCILFISSLTTHIIFPAIFKDISPLSTTMVSQNMFTLTVCYLNHFFSSCIGILSAVFSYLPWFWLPLLMTLIRVLLVGVFLVSNYLPHSRLLSVLIHWDWTLAISVTVFGLLGAFVSQHIRASILRKSENEDHRSQNAMKIVWVSLMGNISGLALSVLLPLVVTVDL